MTNAPEADVFLIYATEDPGSGFEGLCAFLVPRNTPGLAIGEPLHKMGLRTSPMSELYLDGCVVPPESGSCTVVSVASPSRRRTASARAACAAKAGPMRVAARASGT